MAIRIRLSDRPAGGAMPETRTFRPVYNETVGRTTGAVGRQVAGDMIRSINVINQVKERDAQIAATQWETGALRLLNGTTATDPGGVEQHVPGMAQKSWQDYEKEGQNRSPLTDLADYEKEFQNSDAYKRMDNLTRNKFNRLVAERRARYQAHAGELYDRNARAREAYYDQLADKNGDEKLATNFADKNHESFDSMNREVAKEKTDRKFRRMDMSRPEVQVAYNAALIAETKAGAAKRIEALAEAGAKGEVIYVGNEIYSSRHLIDLANEYLDDKMIDNRFNTQESAALKYKIAQAKKTLEGRVAREIKAETEKLELGIDEKAGMQMAEVAISQLPALAKDWYDSTEVANLANAAAVRLNKVCDEKARKEMLDEYLERIKTNPGYRLYEAPRTYGKRKDGTDKEDGFLGPLAIKGGGVATEYSIGVEIDGKEMEIPTLVPALTEAERKQMTEDIIPNHKQPPQAIVDKAIEHAKKRLEQGQGVFAKSEAKNAYPPNSRKGRLAQQVQEAIDAKLEKEARKEFRANHAGNVAAARQMMLVSAAEGAPQAYFRYLTEMVMERRLTVDDYTKLSAEYKSGWLNGYKGQEEQMPKQVQLAGEMLDVVKAEFGVDFAPSLQRLDSGEFKLSKQGRMQIDKKGEALPDVKYERNTGGWWNDTEKFTGEEMVEIINEALSLSLYDGAELTINGEKHRVNAVEDFKAFIHSLKDEKKAKAKAQELADRAMFVQNIRLAAEANQSDSIQRMNNGGVYTAGGNVLPEVEDFLDEE